MRWSRVTAAICLLACLAATGSAVLAAGGRVRPVRGGGSFNDAPILTTGAYKDTIRSRETLYYAVELQAGQRLAAKLFIPQDPSIPGGGAGSMHMSVLNPLREEDPASHKQAGPVGRFAYTLKFVSGEVGGGGPAALDYQEPGTYFFSVRLEDEERALRRREVAIRFELEVRGQAVEPSPSPTPSIVEESPTPEPTPSETPTAPAAAPPSDSSTSSGSLVTIYLACFLSGLLVGGIVAGARFVRRSPAPARK